MFLIIEFDLLANEMKKRKDEKKVELILLLG
jgi:hypothetical protein